MGSAMDDCGCCAGVGAQTPAAKRNAPGLPAVGYRVGDYAAFRATLMARLSSTDFPALAALTTRDGDDWTIGLADAFACVADILTFYQERIANESWLRTAVERRSVLELARLIGYQLAPGVAAGTSLAYTLESAPGLRAQAARPVTITAGSRVQSVPDPDQSAQNFETVADITARVEWNAIPAQTGAIVPIAPGLTELYVAGTGTSLQQGDAILIVGRERMQAVDSEHWDVRWLDAVEPDTQHGVTRLVWSKGLGGASSTPAQQGVHVFVFRQRASLFGNTAPEPKLVWNTNNSSLFTLDKEWSGFAIDPSGQALDLDASYPKVVRHSWIALAGGSGGTAPTGYVALYRVMATTQLSRSAFGLSAKVTRAQLDTNLQLHRFDLRGTQVLAQSDELHRAPRPLRYPVYGSTLTLGRGEPALQPGQMLAVSGKRQRVAIPADATGIGMSDGRAAHADDSFIVLAPPEQAIPGSLWQALTPEQLDPGAVVSGIWRWSVVDDAGIDLTITAPAGRLLLQQAEADDDAVSEIVAIGDGAGSVEADPATTRLTLASPLAHCYDRATVSVNANVAPATHGEGVAEIGGSGDAAQPGQRFLLKQSPLTYVSSSSDPSGALATLQARVGDVLWQERPTLYGTAATDRVYTLRQDDQGRTTVAFGDGVQGARLPSAQNNVRFAYRKGLGAAGNLRAGQLTTLLTRPLGVKGVTNPVPATGGQDAETLDRARTNAPLRILTLGRAVSAQDYADFARTFAGIDKASAIWIASGRARGIYITVAGTGGSPIPAGSDTQANLVAALRTYGDPLLPLAVQSYVNANFTLVANVMPDPAYETAKVLAAVEAALRAAYAFAARDFGQQVTPDEAYAVIQAVPGVIASDITSLYRIDAGPVQPQPQPRLVAALPAVQADGSVNPAELLTLDAGPIQLGVMA